MFSVCIVKTRYCCKLNFVDITEEDVADRLGSLTDLLEQHLEFADDGFVENNIVPDDYRSSVRYSFFPNNTRQRFL
jgi:hypothetical protein